MRLLVYARCVYAHLCNLNVCRYVVVHDVCGCA